MITKEYKKVLETDLCPPDEVIHLTLDEARRLPGMLGIIATANLQQHKAYACTVGNKRKLYILKE